MKKVSIGIITGLIAGVIDVTPMIIQGLSWDANLSAFSMWVVVGFLISVTEIHINPILKGLLISFLTLIPVAILIAWKEPFSLVPISIMTVILGGLSGYTINRLSR